MHTPSRGTIFSWRQVLSTWEDERRESEREGGGGGKGRGTGGGRRDSAIRQKHRRKLATPHAGGKTQHASAGEP